MADYRNIADMIANFLISSDTASISCLPLSGSMFFVNRSGRDLNKAEACRLVFFKIWAHCSARVTREEGVRFAVACPPIGLSLLGVTASRAGLPLSSTTRKNENGRHPAVL